MGPLPIRWWGLHFIVLNAQWFRGPGRKVPLLAIIRHRASLTLGRGFVPFMCRVLPFSAAALCGNQRWGMRKEVSRRCLQRRLPFLPCPYIAAKGKSTNGLGDDSIF